MMFIKKYCHIILLALCMLVCVGFISCFAMADQVCFDSVSFYDSQYQLEYKPFYDEKEDRYYLFLPSYTDKTKISEKCENGVSISFSDKETGEPCSFAELPTGRDILASIENPVKRESFTLQVLQCESAPTVYIETRSGSMAEVDSDKEKWEESAVIIIRPDGTEEYMGMAEISGAGVSTFGQLKKPYNLKFNYAVELFDIAQVQRWRLMANYADESMLRNYVCYNAAKDIGIAHTGGMEYVSVYLNGRYNGLYTLCTKYKYENDLDSLSALFEKTDFGREGDYITDYDTKIIFRYGDSETVTAAVNALEDALFGAKSYDQVASCIDVPSFARKFVLEDVMANFDNRLSQYFAINSEGKIEAVCAWDYDLSLGISWNALVDIPCNSATMANPWYTALFEFSEFRELVTATAEELSPVFTDRVPGYLSEAVHAMGGDYELNDLRWRNLFSFNNGATKLKSTPPMQTAESHARYIESFIARRLEFLQDYWANSEDYCSLTFKSHDTSVNGNYPRNIQLTADMLPDGVLRAYDTAGGFLGWYSDDGLSILDVESLTGDMVFSAKFEGDSAPLPENSLPSAQAPAENPVVSMVKWSVTNLGLRNLAFISAFGLFFVLLVILEIVRGRQRKAAKK